MRQRRILADSGLHDTVRHRYWDEVTTMAVEVAAAFPSNQEIHIDQVCQALVIRLLELDGLHREIIEQFEAGGLPQGVQENDILDAVALWIIEQQLHDSVQWEPAGSAPGTAARESNRRSPIKRLRRRLGRPRHPKAQ